MIINEFPKFINNTPDGKDQFLSGSHSKIALSIAEHIENNSSSYRLIGLEGEWGSGKSNVTKIIYENLKQKTGKNYEHEKGFHFFIYDAWSHQEDLQRRSFLEELIDDLQEKGIVDKETWEQNLNELLAKKRTTISKNAPVLSIYFLLAIFIIVFTPIFTTISESISFRTFPQLHIVVVLVPIIISCIILGITFFRKRKAKSNGEKSDNNNIQKYSLRDFWNEFLESVATVYTRKIVEEVKNEVIKEKEPSIREFKIWMGKLSSSIKKNLIIVFDNMDRLPPNKIQNLWSSVHTFFSDENTRHNNIWVIIPFDRVHIKKAFDDKGDGEDNSRASDFISKTFSVVYRVSPIVLNDWKNFFETKYKEAFGESENVHLRGIRNIFDLHSSKIKPREIISFINELVSIKLVWKDEIPLNYCAVFTLKREKITNITQIIEKSFLGELNVIYQNDNDLTKYIAALVYNIPPVYAIQVPLTGEVLDSLRKGNKETMQKIQSDSNFLPILVSIIHKELYSVETATKALSGLDYEASNEDYTQIWKIIINKHTQNKISNFIFSETDKYLLTKADEAHQKKLLSFYLAEYQKIQPFSTNSYFSVVQQMCEFTKVEDLKIDVFSFLIKMKVPPIDFIDFVNAAKENYKKYKIECDRLELDGYISEYFLTNLELGKPLTYIAKDYNLSILKAKIESLITNGTEITVDNFNEIFDAYKILSTDKPLTAKLSSEKIDSLFDETSEDSVGDNELIAMSMANLKETYNSDSFIYRVFLNNAENSESKMNHVSRVLEYYTTYGDILLKSAERQYPFFAGVANYLTNNINKESKLDILEILPQYIPIKNTLNISDEILIKRLDYWVDDLKHGLNKNNLTEIIPDSAFYNHLTGNNSNFKVTIIKIANDYIKSLTHEQWTNTFADVNSYNFTLLYFLLAQQYIDSVPNNSFEAYKQSLKNNAEIDELKFDNYDEWNLIYEKTDKKHLTGTFLNIRDMFTKREAEITPNKFLFFENPFRELGRLEEKSSDIVRIVLTSIIDNELCLQKIIEFSDFYIPLIYKSGDVSFDYIDRLFSKIEASTNLQSASDIANQLSELFSADVEIILAEYGHGENIIDVTYYIDRKVKSDKKLHFLVNNKLFDDKDPKPNEVKNLSIEYTYKGNPFMKIFEEHKWVRLL